MLQRSVAAAVTHQANDPGKGFALPFLYSKMSFFSQVA